jgi:Fanconi anemia group M protein
MSVPIIVDDRELRAGLVEALTRAMRGRPSVARLPLGDVAIGTRWLIERKAVADFAASMREGRLEDQMTRLAGARDRDGRSIMLILEGSVTPESLPGEDLDLLMREALRIVIDWRIPVLRTADIDDTARWLTALAHREDSAGPASDQPYRPSRPAAAPRPLKIRPSVPRNDPVLIQMAALARIPYLGPNKARALLDRFGSIGGLQKASDADLLGVAGIGPELVTAIRKVFPADDGGGTSRQGH